MAIDFGNFRKFFGISLDFFPIPNIMKENDIMR